MQGLTRKSVDSENIDFIYFK